MNNEIIMECINAVRNHQIKNNYHIDYPNQKMMIFINDDEETKQEHELFINSLKTNGFTIIYTNAIDDYYYITAIDNIKQINGNLHKWKEFMEYKEEIIDLTNQNLKLYNRDKIDNKEIMKKTGNLKYWI